jgi:hypothetical protein
MSGLAKLMPATQKLPAHSCTVTGWPCLQRGCCGCTQCSSRGQGSCSQPCTQSTVLMNPHNFYFIYVLKLFLIQNASNVYKGWKNGIRSLIYSVFSFNNSQHFANVVSLLNSSPHQMRFYFYKKRFKVHPRKSIVPHVNTIICDPKR